MHVAVVTTLPPSRGSLNEYGAHLVQALARNPEVTRLSVVADVPEVAAEDAGLSLPGHVDVQRVWRFGAMTTALTIERTLRALAPDGVIFNLQFASFGQKRVPAALGLLAPAASRMRRPTVTLLHNIVETVDLKNAGFGGNAIDQTLVRLAGTAMTRALLASDRLALTLPRYVDIVERKYRARNVLHVPHGTFADPGAVAELPEAPTVMTFGKFGTYKRVEILFEAHERLLQRDPRTRLVIAGSDSPNAPGYLAEMQARFGHLPNVRFTGYVAEEDVPRIFGDATVVAFPYRSTTGSSGVLHQAGQYGRAAVMPRIGDLAELAENEGYAFHDFAPDDVDALTEGLWDILSDPAKARSMGEANRRAASGPTIDTVAGTYVQTLHDVKEARHAHRGA
jgi:glycosyltransferase involved in cell wall biosynthesis